MVIAPKLNRRFVKAAFKSDYPRRRALNRRKHRTRHSAPDLLRVEVELDVVVWTGVDLLQHASPVAYVHDVPGQRVNCNGNFSLSLRSVADKSVNLWRDSCGDDKGALVTRWVTVHGSISTIIHLEEAQLRFEIYRLQGLGYKVRERNWLLLFNRRVVAQAETNFFLNLPRTCQIIFFCMLIYVDIKHHRCGNL